MALAYKIEPDVQPTRSIGSPELVHFPGPAVLDRNGDNAGPGPSAKAASENAVNHRSGKSATVASIADHPKTRHLPLWIKLLVGVQQGSTVITGGLMAAALVVYSWTVYVDKMVFRTGRELDTLQTEMQQITTANETLKHNMANQAEASSSRFHPYEPDNTIFLEPAPNRYAPNAPEGSITHPASNQPNMPHPLGY